MPSFVRHSDAVNSATFLCRSLVLYVSVNDSGFAS